ncbi:MAG TPA: trypsin-like peptidase domain-containing protein [Bryobacteraceae bacterium]|nr:trypsin-like peptidase domain-containing protein [Bryobacteraceae bacterium]
MGIGEVGEHLRRSTVHIRNFNGRGQSAGSGVVWDGDGTVITNAHVLGKGAHSVELWDGRTIPAELKLRDDQRDLAKLKLHTGGVTAVSFRESPVKPGELVVAVGNPLGFTGALTTGVVHALGPVTSLGRRRWVQAAIRLAPGNSGGPLADAAGRLVGINTMIVSGIALAIPISAVWDFIRNGTGPSLGVTVQPVNLGPRRGLGLLVLSVERGSPAEYASLLIGDLLVGANGTPFDIPADLADSIRETGKHTLKLQFIRSDSAREREVAIQLRDGANREAA